MSKSWDKLMDRLDEMDRMISELREAVAGDVTSYARKSRATQERSAKSSTKWITVTIGTVPVASTAYVGTAISDHEALPDPHPGYLTPAEGNAAYDVIGAGAAAVGTHEGSFTHSDISLNTTHRVSTANPHTVTAAQAGADPAGTAASTMSAHTGSFVHADIALNTTHRGLVTGNPHAVTAAQVGALAAVSGDTTPSLGGTLTAGSNRIDGGSGNDIVFRLGDALGANDFAIQDFGGTEVARVTSLGVGHFASISLSAGSTFVQTYTATTLTVTNPPTDSTTGTGGTSVDALPGATDTTDCTSQINDNFATVLAEIIINRKLINSLVDVDQAGGQAK